MAKKFTAEDIEILENHTAYQGYFRIKKYQIKHRLFENGDWGKPLTREVFERGHAVGVLLFDPKLNKIILIEQFRIGTYGKTNHPWLTELVAGMVGKDETAEAVARREAKEEANVEILDLVPMFQHYWSSPGATSETVSLFCGRVDASNAGGIHGLAEEGEDIRVLTMDVAEVYQAVEEGRINNALSIIAIQWFQLNEKKIRAQWS